MVLFSRSELSRKHPNQGNYASRFEPPRPYENAANHAPNAAPRYPLFSCTRQVTAALIDLSGYWQINSPKVVNAKVHYNRESLMRRSSTAAAYSEMAILVSSKWTEEQTCFQ
jgi:hypothetical protein